MTDEEKKTENESAPEAEISDVKAKEAKVLPSEKDPDTNEVEDLSSEDEYLALLKEGEQKREEEVKKEEPQAEDDDEKISIMSVDEHKKKKKKEEPEVIQTEESTEPKIYALRTTANREDQVMSFVGSNAARKKLKVYSVVRPHGMRGYIFIEAATRAEAEASAFGVPYARGLLPNIIQYKEIEHMLEQVKKDVNIQKNDIAEIISGPFKREKCKITRIDKTKEEVVVELLEAAVPIPLTLKMDAVKVIRRDEE
ncbi:transcription elongation factor Spt5 [Candidatus Woesearchaeota archaeon]|nr:transcription elongation factor Spt5 [Candidatus Woesearchaeota archaeon]